MPHSCHTFRKTTTASPEGAARAAGPSKARRRRSRPHALLLMHDATMEAILSAARAYQGKGLDEKPDAAKKLRQAVLGGVRQPAEVETILSKEGGDPTVRTVSDSAWWQRPAARPTDQPPPVRRPPCRTPCAPCS